MLKFKKIIAVLLAVLVILGCSGCASWNRFKKTMSSDFSGGLWREVTVYSMTGEVIAKHEGQIDIQESGNKVLFDLDGKRYVYYNCMVEVIEK